MPPKASKSSKISKSSKSPKEETNVNTKEDNVIDNTDDIDEPPALEYVSNTTKERYEYTPELRNEIVYRRPEDRVTSEVMTRFELCEIISIRAKQLEKGHKVFTDVGELTNPIDIARKEILDKKCPLSIRRMITDKVGEKWQANEMAIPHDAF